MSALTEQTMTARRLLITAALAAWIVTAALRDWIRSLDDAELGYLMEETR